MALAQHWARAQQMRWPQDPNDSILATLNDKLASALEGIADATERQAQEQIRVAPLARRQELGGRFGKIPAAAPPSRQPGGEIMPLLAAERSGAGQKGVNPRKDG